MSLDTGTAIRNLRQYIDSLAMYTGIMTSPTATDKNLHSCSGHLLKAKSWLGKALGFMGNPNPYPPADKAREIPPTQDVGDTPLHFEGDYLEVINTLRERIQKSIDDIVNLKAQISFTSFEGPTAFTNAWTAACNARFALGFELENLREDALAQQP